MNRRSFREHLASALGLGEGETPFPWQVALLERMCEGDIPAAIDIPTGLGKTGTIAIWLLARACGADVPRRLVYVVDRRAVVDQATEVALGLRRWVADRAELKAALGLGARELPISTLRGQFVDNREWLEDPARPAIVVGTVDMVGSRLLFEGYGVSRKMRPYYAGMLGCDCLYALDESHLVPPFEALIHAATTRHEAHAPREIPRSRLMSLSATGAFAIDDGEPAESAKVHRLTKADREHPEVAKRLGATKRIELRVAPEGSLVDAMVEEAWARVGDRARRCVVFTTSREEATKIEQGLRARLADQPEDERGEVELLTGGRRVRERMLAAEKLRSMGFIAGAARPSRPAFLVATSAGEVGVDLDADDMVADLVSWERMVQRLGRVNRRGAGEAHVTVFERPSPDKATDADREREVARRTALQALPSSEGTLDGSPGAIVETLGRMEPEVVALASSPLPLHPPLELPTLEAWAMTSLREHTGRPEVAPWLRGWVETEPQTRLVWRSELPAMPGERPSVARLARYLTAAPPHASELLEVPTYQAVDWLQTRFKRLLKQTPDAQRAPSTVVVLNDANEVEAVYEVDNSSARRSGSLVAMDKKRQFRTLRDRTLVLFGIAGLDPQSGLLDGKSDDAPPMADTALPWGEDAPDHAPVPPFRVRRESSQRPRTDESEQAPDLEARVVSAPGETGGWHPWERIPLIETDDAEQAWLVVEKWRDASADEDDRAVAKKSQSLLEHQQWTEAQAVAIAERLGLDPALAKTVAVAARWHDQGKASERWQRAFSAPVGERPLAKTRGPVRARHLGGYRHELGSILRSRDWDGFDELDEEHRDLALHLVAAHHGHARPFIATNGCDGQVPSMLEETGRQVALRFVHLQDRWTPWGLAWLETLVRAADQQASRRLEESGEQL